MKYSRLFKSVLTGIAFLIACDSGNAQQTGPAPKPDDDKVVAKVGERKFTLKEFNEEFAKVPPQAQAQFEGAAGRKDFLDRLVLNELVYLDALAGKMDSQDEVLKQLEDLKRRVLLRYYYEKEIQGKAVLTPQELEAYYKNHPDEFVEQKKIKARHILTDTEDKAKAIKKRLDSGEKFEDIAGKESLDESTSKRGGVMGYLSEENDYIPYVGKSDEFKKFVFGAALNTLSAPIKTEKGFHLAEVVEIKERRQKPFDEVKEQIEANLKPDKLKQLTDALMTQLREKYHYEFYEDSFAEKKNPKDLFDKAQNTKDPHEALRLYQEIGKDFANTEHAPKAQFMVGFVYSEQLGDKAKAKEAFQTVITKFPESELADDARWMLENMNKKPDELGNGDKPADKKDETAKPEKK